MNTLGEKIKLVNRLQTEMEHRRKIEDEAEQMIIDGKFLEATELLQSLDDNLIKDLANELSELSRPEDETDRCRGENKKEILFRLEKLLRATRAGSDVVTLLLNERLDTVTIQFKTGFERKVNIAGDSGYAIIHDVMKVI